MPNLPTETPVAGAKEAVVSKSVAVMEKPSPSIDHQAQEMIQTAQAATQGVVTPDQAFEAIDQIDIGQPVQTEPAEVKQGAPVEDKAPTQNSVKESEDQEGVGIEVEGANEEERKYYQALFKTMNKIYKEKFPEIYQGRLGYKIRYNYEEPYNGKAVITSAVSYNPFKKIINCDNGTSIVSANNASKDRVESGMGFRVQRIIADTVSLAHEYTHAIYEKLSPSGLQQYPDVSFTTADQTFNEGFATMMTYLFIDALKRDPQLLGLDAEGIGDLNHYSSAALYGNGEDAGLRRFDQEYVQGTLKVFHKIFAEAAGSPKTRDVSKGLTAMRTFVEGLDRTKTLQTDMQDPKFQTLVKARDTGSLRAEFAR